MTGFRLKWFILVENGSDTTSGVNVDPAKSTQPVQSTKTSETTMQTTIFSEASSVATSIESLTNIETTTLNTTTSDYSEGKYKEEWLGRMVEVARLARLANMTRNQIILHTLRLKIYNTSFLHLYDHCDGGQLGKDNQTDVFNDINTILNKDNKTGTIDDMDDEDLKTGNNS